MSRNRKFASLAFAVSTSVIIALPATVHAEGSASKHVMFILDASNSMWGQIGGKAKIQIAKEVLKSQVAALPAGTKAGLIAYGHRFAKELNDCEDMELVSGYSLDSPQLVDEALNYVVPKGQTPIARTLEESINWVKGPIHENPVTNPTVVLITDGAESCDGNPCLAAKKLADAGINTKIHVVGFGLNEQQRGQVQCIAENGHGKYFDATDATGLNDALKQVEVEMAQVAPEPAAPAQATPPAPTSFFLDEFDGTELSGAWQVIAPDPDAFIVEDGKLLMVSSKLNGFGTDPAENIVTFTKDLPAGDWDMTADFKAELKTGADFIQFGLYKDTTNYLAASIWNQTNSANKCGQLVLRLLKVTSGESTKFDNRIAGTKVCGFGNDNHIQAISSLSEAGAKVTVSKRGREYSASIILPGLMENGAPVQVATEALTSLRAPGKPSMSVGKFGRADGEIVTYFDKVEILSIK